MRQEQRDAGDAAPFGLARTDELIDDDLRAVAEVAELSFPNGQAARFGGGEAVFESHDGFFRQYGIGHGELRLIGRQVLQRHVSASGGLVVQNGMAMEESAAAAI